jgi:hypothetical protein
MESFKLNYRELSALLGVYKEAVPKKLQMLGLSVALHGSGCKVSSEEVFRVFGFDVGSSLIAYINNTRSNKD